jgi:hypothetical protein
VLTLGLVPAVGVHVRSAALAGSVYRPVDDVPGATIDRSAKWREVVWWE